MYRRSRGGGSASPWTAALIVGVLAVGVGGAVSYNARRHTVRRPLTTYNAPLTPYQNIAPDGRNAVYPVQPTTPLTTTPRMGATPGGTVGGTPGTTAQTGATNPSVGNIHPPPSAPSLGGAGVSGSAMTTTPSYGYQQYSQLPSYSMYPQYPQYQTTPAPTGAPAPGAAPAPAPAPAAAPAPVQPSAQPKTVSGQATMESEMLKLVNSARAQSGLPALTLDPQLQKIARTKSQDMINRSYFSHQSPTYGSPFDMLRSFGVSYRAAGENIALNQSTPAAHTALMNSPGHRANILGRQYSKVGIGIVKGSQGYYFTQLFTG